jgi:protein O-mannosyl-transferase
LKNRSSIFVICSLLALTTWVAYWPVTRHQFVNFDDPHYISDNPHVKAGLTWSGLLWAFQSGYASNWHPLTWISHMVDCQLYGLSSAGHYLTNLLFHLANTLLLFLLLRRLTGSLGRSAFVAALFAWHPLHVESVAWASERKDVLSTFFFLLTLWSYVRYAEVQRLRSNVQSQGTEDRSQNEATRHTPHAILLTPPESRYYVLSLFLFALGLMSKPMLVTLPFVLLLLDFWPLGRLQFSTLNSQPSTLWRLLREKLPFFALALVTSIVTYLVQRSGGAVSSLELVPFHSRITNALVAYVRYLSLTLWPAQLAVVYPYSKHLAAGSVIAAALLLAGVSGFFLSRARRQPYLAVGWLWFLGTLVPTIGLVQVGPQCMADRYTYIPSIGLFLLLVWGLDALLDPWPPKRLCLPVAGTLALAACLACTCRQLTYWQDSESLFRRAIAVTMDNHIAHINLGKALVEQGKTDEAAVHLDKAVRLTPDDPEAQYNLGTVLALQAKPDEAITCFSAALRLNPEYGDAHGNLGVTLMRQGKPDQGAAHLAAAVKLKPDDPQVHYNLGLALLELNRPREAADRLTEALRLNPDAPGPHYHLALALVRQDKPQEALSHVRKACELVMKASPPPDTLQKQIDELKRKLAALPPTASPGSL